MLHYTYKTNNQMINYIKTNFSYLLLLAVIISFASCQDIIEIDVQDSQPKLVVDGLLNVVEQNAKVKVSKTTPIFGTDTVAQDFDAIVSLVDAAGNSIPLSKVAPGEYEANDVIVETGEDWTLVVEVDNDIYRGNAIVPEFVELAKVDTLQTAFTFGDTTVVFYQVAMEWIDVLDVDNFYRLQSYINDTLETGQYFLYADSQNNGIAMNRPIMSFYQPGQNITLELYSTNESYYDFYLQVASIQEQGFGGTTPFNPQGNMFDSEGNHILGNFGIIQSSSINVQL